MDETQDQRRQRNLDEAPPAQDVLMEFPVFRIQLILSLNYLWSVLYLETYLDIYNLG